MESKTLLLALVGFGVAAYVAYQLGKGGAGESKPSGSEPSQNAPAQPSPPPSSGLDEGGGNLFPGLSGMDEGYPLPAGAERVRVADPETPPGSADALGGGREGALAFGGGRGGGGGGDGRGQVEG
jgi:hypothetical protein